MVISTSNQVMIAILKNLSPGQMALCLMSISGGSPTGMALCNIHPARLPLFLSPEGHSELSILTYLSHALILQSSAWSGALKFVFSKAKIIHNVSKKN